MGRRIHSNYFEDNYLKYECQKCRRCFILGEILSRDMDIRCPYCGLLEIEIVTAATEESTADMDMGCLGLYYNHFDDGSLMLYTERELCEALEDTCEYRIPGETVMDSLNRYCTRRDGCDK